jgi:2-hydroxy-3-keto-5-methylthiopentenyl-1-phosphate phosphatase
MYKKIVFIDFDGTITSEETLVGAMKRLVSKEVFEKGYAEAMETKKTISESLREFFHEIPSNKISEIMAYIETVPIRPGFEEFLDYMKEVQIPVVVISGGLKQMVYSKIEKYKDQILDIYCVDLDLSGELMRLDSKFDDGIELLKKTDIMEFYNYEKAISIGDSYTDMKIAMASDQVFARDDLANYLTDVGKPYEKWDDFYDILEVMKSELSCCEIDKSDSETSF